MTYTLSIPTVEGYSWRDPADKLTRLADSVDRYLKYRGDELPSAQKDKLRFLIEGIRGNGRALATLAESGLIAGLERDIHRLRESIERVKHCLDDAKGPRELISHLSLVFNLATTISRVVLPLLG